MKLEDLYISPRVTLDEVALEMACALGYEEMTAFVLQLNERMYDSVFTRGLISALEATLDGASCPHKYVLGDTVSGRRRCLECGDHIES